MLKRVTIAIGVVGVPEAIGAKILQREPLKFRRIALRKQGFSWRSDALRDAAAVVEGARARYALDRIGPPIAISFVELQTSVNLRSQGDLHDHGHEIGAEGFADVDVL